MRKLLIFFVVLFVCNNLFSFQEDTTLVKNYCKSIYFIDNNRDVFIKTIEVNGMKYIEISELKNLIKILFPNINGRIQNEQKYEMYTDNINVLIDLNRSEIEYRENCYNAHYNYNLNELGLEIIRSDDKYFLPVSILGLVFFEAEISFVETKSAILLFDRAGMKEATMVIKSFEKKVLSMEMKYFMTKYIEKLLELFYVRYKGKVISESNLDTINIKNFEDDNNFYMAIKARINSFNDFHVSFTKYDDSKEYISYFYEGTVIEKQNKITFHKNYFDLGDEISRIESQNENNVIDSFNSTLFDDEQKYINIETAKGKIILNKIFLQNINFPDDIIYLPIRTFNEYYFEIYTDKIKQNKWLIIDLRWNKGGSAANVIELASKIIKEPFNDFYIVPYKYDKNEYKSIIKNYKEYFNGNLIVLVNRFSYSASNAFLGIVRESGAGIILGEESAGGNGVPNDFMLPEGSILRFPVSFYLIGKDKKDYEKGISPDIYCKDEIVEGTDKMLKRALKYIDDFKKGNEPFMVH